MWKVLGKEALPVTVGDVWLERVLQLSGRKKGAAKFREMMESADFRHFHDAIKEVHTFILRFDPSVATEDLHFIHDFILRLHSSAKVPVVEFDGKEQRFSVVITAEEEKDDHKKRNAWWENSDVGQATDE